MCVLCVEIQKQRMTVREVASAYREFAIPEGHEKELHDTIENNYDKDEVVGELAELEVTEHYKKTKERV